MRILYVTDGIAPHVIGGMQTIARAQVSALVEAGHEVILVTSRLTPGERLDLPCRSVAIEWPRRTRLMQMSPWRYVNDLKSFSRLAADVADETRPDAIYSEGPLMDAYLARPRSQRVPVVFHPHGLEMYQHKGDFVEDLKSLPLRAIVARHCRQADIVISYGGRLTEIIGRLGVETERMAILPNSGPQFAAAPGPRSKTGKFLFVGRSERRKGVDVLLKAIAKCKGARLDIVGFDGPSGGVIDRVTFHGPFRDRNSIMEYYWNAEFLIVPSFAEGMPTVIVEALSTGLPVIASDVGAVNELVREGETGFLVTAGDAGQLEAVMKQAMALPLDSYRRMSKNCSNLVRASFSQEHTRARLARIFDSLEGSAAKGDLGRPAAHPNWKPTMRSES